MKNGSWFDLVSAGLSWSSAGTKAGPNQAAPAQTRRALKTEILKLIIHPNVILHRDFLFLFSLWKTKGNALVNDALFSIQIEVNKKLIPYTDTRNSHQELMSKRGRNTSSKN